MALKIKSTKEKKSPFSSLAAAVVGSLAAAAVTTAGAADAQADFNFESSTVGDKGCGGEGGCSGKCSGEKDSEDETEEESKEE